MTLHEVVVAVLTLVITASLTYVAKFIWASMKNLKPTSKTGIEKSRSKREPSIIEYYRRNQ